MKKIYTLNEITPLKPQPKCNKPINQIDPSAVKNPAPIKYIEHHHRSRSRVGLYTSLWDRWHNTPKITRTCAPHASCRLSYYISIYVCVVHVAFSERQHTQQPCARALHICLSIQLIPRRTADDMICLYQHALANHWYVELDTARVQNLRRRKH